MNGYLFVFPYLINLLIVSFRLPFAFILNLIEFPLITKGGARIEVLLNATTRRDEHGKVIGVVGIGQDITGRIAQEREYSKLIDTANAPIFGVDNKGQVNVWNQCAMRLVGYSPEEVMVSPECIYL